ncbi:MAG: deoxyribose-phosphate aldolase [Verrucomicrobia bacterium]|nr:deoxyribose-phosphate aldolase [Verrucomicrobiota bacterium]
MPPPLTAKDLARYIDYTLLKPEASRLEINKLCSEAREYQFYSVCVNGSRVIEAYALLDGSGVKVSTTVGFPLGAADADAKRYETEVAIDNGAHEIDAVLNIGRLKEGDHQYVLRELRDIVGAADERPVKVILETCLLTRDEKVLACKLAVDSGAHFVKTSTGFSSSNGTIEDVKLLREIVGPKFGVKASGGIRDTRTALSMIEAGANRLGTSAGVAIVRALASSR